MQKPYHAPVAGQIDPNRIAPRDNPLFTGAVTVPAGTPAAPGICATGDSNTGLHFPAADTTAFIQGGQEAGRFEPGGRLSIGAPGQSLLAGFMPSLLVVNTSSAASFGIARYSAASPTAAAQIVLGRSRGGAVGMHLAAQAGDTCGQILGAGSDGTQFQQAAAMRTEIDGPPVAGSSMPGRWVWLTTAAGSVTPTERLRLSSDGSLTHRGAGGTVIVDASSHLGLRSYTVGTLPSAAAAGRLIHVAGGSANWQIATSDGAVWRFPDGSVVA